MQARPAETARSNITHAPHRPLGVSALRDVSAVEIKGGAVLELERSAKLEVERQILEALLCQLDAGLGLAGKHWCDGNSVSRLASFSTVRWSHQRR